MYEFHFVVCKFETQLSFEVRCFPDRIPTGGSSAMMEYHYLGLLGIELSFYPIWYFVQDGREFCSRVAELDFIYMSAVNTVPIAYLIFAKIMAANNVTW